MTLVYVRFAYIISDTNGAQLTVIDESIGYIYIA